MDRFFSTPKNRLSEFSNNSVFPKTSKYASRSSYIISTRGTLLAEKKTFLYLKTIQKQTLGHLEK